MSGIYRGPNGSATADALNIDGDKGDLTISNSGLEWTINPDVVDFSKMQNISTDVLLGRASAGSGNIEEITCTQAGRDLLDDVDVSAQRTTLGLGSIATQGDGDKGDITVSGSGASWTIDNDVIDNSNVNPSAAIEATKLQFTQTGTGATARTVQSKLRDAVSVKDFGAVGDGVTDNLTAITNAIAAASGKTIFVPVDSTGGDYAIKSGTLTIPSTARFEYEAGARIYASGGTISDSGRHFYLFGGGAGEGKSETLTRGFALELNGGNSGTAPASTLHYNRIRIVGDTVDAEPDANGTKVDGLLVQHSFGGAGTKGGRHAIEGILTQDAITEATNPDRNYVGVVGFVSTSVGDGGSSGAGQGGYFGSNFVATHTGGNYVFNLTGGEFNTDITAQGGGNEVHYHSGLQIVNGGTAQGYTIDAAVAIGTKGGLGSGGLPRVPWRNVIRIGKMHGGDPLGLTSKIIACETDAASISTAFDLPPCSVAVLNSGDVELTNTALKIKSANASITLGDDNNSGASIVNYRSSGLNASYDSRIVASGGSASVGAGVLTFNASSIQLAATSEVVTSSTVRPGADNVNNIGRSDRRYATIFAGTGTINTPDIREKQQIRGLSDSEKAVATKLKGLIKAFKFNDSVNTKGDKARIHFGVMAQEVKSAFESEGLFAEDYAILCYDEWEESQELLNDAGEIIQEYNAAGNRYGIRYDELLAFIICAM